MVAKMHLKTRRFFLISVLGVCSVCCLVALPSLLHSQRCYYGECTVGGNVEEDAITAADINLPPLNATSWRNFTPEEISAFSRLGRLLFLDDNSDLRKQNTTFNILVWKFGKFLERRHMKHFSNQFYDPFENCSVSNCIIKYEDEDLPSADAVIFHLHRTESPQILPSQDERLPQQIWVFLSDESPYNTFLYGSEKNSLPKYNNVFNWTMTYRLDSDVPVPYGRTVVLSDKERIHMRKMAPRNYASGKTGLVAVMGSNCHGVNKRWDYVKELQKHMHVDVYGGCGTLKCAGHFTQDCPKLKNYKFYLSFENSNCQDYITEKVWWNAYKHEAVPIVMGPSKTNCLKLLPKKSYLHVSDFASPAVLAHFLIYLNRTDEEYNTYFEWKKDFKVINEHGYFQSPVFHYCRLCEALNYNDKTPKTYENLEDFWSVGKYCR